MMKVQPRQANSNNLSAIQTILIAGLIAGTLDISAAILILAKGQAALVLKYIATSVFGKEAFAGGADMIAIGLLFHYIIAYSFTVLYFIIYPYVPLLKKSIALSSILYGLFVWFLMNWCVVPLTKVHTAPFHIRSAITNAVILMVCIALPIAYFTARYNARKNQG
jgi:uncharacterized membrane protein YagU involved in acid resistance